MHSFLIINIPLWHKSRIIAKYIFEFRNLFCIFATNMKEFVISEAKTETAVLVGLITPNQNEAKTTEYLDELEFLADTAGAKVLKRFTQRVNGPSSVTYVGTGKLEEIRAYIEECEDHVENEDVHPDGTPWEEVGMVIFDDELSA